MADDPLSERIVILNRYLDEGRISREQYDQVLARLLGAADAGPAATTVATSPPPQSGARKRLWGLATLLIIVSALVLLDNYLPTDSSSRQPADRSSRVSISSPPQRTVMSDRFDSLRDEAIRNVGWIAGNAEGHPIWPQLRGYVEPGGTYYSYVRLSSGRFSGEAEAAANVQLYREWRKRGAAVPYNESEAMSRTRRLVAIADELTAEMKKHPNPPAGQNK